jgi:hypothetical protein
LLTRVRDPFEILVAVPWKRVALVCVAAVLLVTGGRWKMAHDAERRASREAADRAYWTEQHRQKLRSFCAEHLEEWRALVARRREDDALRTARECLQFGEEYRELAQAGQKVAAERDGNLCQVLKPRLDELIAERDYCGFVRENTGDCGAIYAGLVPFAAEARARCASGRS